METKDSKKTMTIEQENKIISIELYRKLLRFVANANNVLMDISVQGDNVLKSAKVMNEAHDLIKELQE